MKANVEIQTMAKSLILFVAHWAREVTWDQIRKKGFSSPSKCPLCGNHEETLEHLLNQCEVTENLWHQVELLFGHLDRSPNSTNESLELWRIHLFKNPILNRARFLPKASYYGMFGKPETVWCFMI